MSAPTITIAPDYTPGVTLNSQLQRAQPPFEPDSFAKIFSDDNFNKLEPAQSGKFEQKFEATLNAYDKVKALGVEGQLNLSYGPVSGDANLKFAMDNTKDQFSLSVIYSTTRTGKERRVDGASLDDLELDGPVLAEIKEEMTFEEFTAKYGKYVVIGYEYGGSILFDLTYSCDSSGDKMSVAGGLSVAYDKVPGFNISGSASGDYKQEDINKSLKNKVETSIQPSSISAKQTELVKLFNKLSNAGSEKPDTLAKYKEDIDGRINELLNPENGELDKVKAIIVKIENIRCVSRAKFISTEAKQKSISDFIEFANKLYLSVKSQSETMKQVLSKWTNNPPVELLKNYRKSLSRLQQFMGTLNDEDKIYKYAKLYDSFLNGDSEGDANAETKDDNDTDGRRQIDIPAKEFYKIDKGSLDDEFEEHISKPYEESTKHEAEEDTKYNDDEGATMAYKSKKIKRWSNSDLLDWIKSIGLSEKWQSVMVEAITVSGCTGQDFAALESDEQLGTSLNIKIPMLYKRVFREMEKVKKEQEDAAVSAAMSNLGNDNNSSNTTGGSTTKSSLSYGKAIEQKDGKFELCIFGQSKYWTLKEKATKDTKVRRVQELYKDAAAIDKPIEDIVLMAKGKTLAPDKTLGYYGIADDRHTITVKFKVVGGTEASIAYLCFFI